MTKTCEQCGEVFSRPPSQKARFCSKACANANRQANRLRGTCANCGASYTRTAQLTIPKYCSDSCRREYREKRRATVCAGCGITYQRQSGRPVGRYCTHACYRQFGASKIRNDRVEHRARTARDHPIAPASGIVAVARLNLFDKIGPGSHPCHWCGIEVSWGTDLQADHLDEDRVNNEPDNLVAACNRCNAWRSRWAESFPYRQQQSA